MAKQYQLGDTVSNEQGHKLVLTEQGWLDWRSPQGNKAFAASQTPEPSTMARIGRGMMDVGMGVPQALGLLPPETEATEKADISLYEQGAGPGIDWARLGGQAAATAPLAVLPGMAATSLAGRTAAGAAAGGLSGASVFAKEEGDRAANTMMGTAAGGAVSAIAPPLLKGLAKAGAAVGRGTSRLWRSLQPDARAKVAAIMTESASKAGMSLDELSDGARKSLYDQAAKAFRAGSLDGDALIRKARAADLGFVDEAAPMRGQLTRNARQFSDEQNLSKLDAGAGAPINNRYEAQRARIGSVLDETRRRIGASADESIDEAGEAIEAAAQKRATDWQNKVTAKYNEARELAPDTMLPGERLSKSVEGVLKERRNSIPADVRRRISELSKDKIDPVELENLDKLLSVYHGSDKATNSALSLIKDRVRGLMDEAGEEFGGAYKEAVAESARRFSAIGPGNKMTAQLVRGAFDPERVAPKLMTGSVRQIEKLRGFIADSDPEAWRRAGAAVWNEITRKAMPSGNFSQAAYNRAIQSIGKKRLSLLYGPDVTDHLMKFGKVTEDLFSFPAGHRVNTSNTASSAANMLRSAVGGVSDLVPGGRVLTPLINSITSDSASAAQRKAVESALSGAPAGAPLGQIPPGLESLLSRGAALSPAAGLLGQQK